MLTFVELAPRDQKAFPDDPYDRWYSLSGEVSAMFYRIRQSYLARFPTHADFLIDFEQNRILCTPVPETPRETSQILYRNTILPLIGNHLGGIHLHASAISNDGDGIAFMGMSRRGKTTLAAAFARIGIPFLTEDLLEVQQTSSGYWAQPGRPVLRLFQDSAANVLQHRNASEPSIPELKYEFGAGDRLPAENRAVLLKKIYMLGPGSSETISLKKINAAAALTHLMRHTFILDVEDKARMRAHFDRLAEMAETVPCFELDFPRRYESLPEVMNAVVKNT